MLAGDAPEVVDERVARLWHVEHRRRPVDLDPPVVELVPEHEHRHVLVASGVLGLDPLRVGRDRERAVGRHPAGDEAHLRSPVASSRREHPLVLTREVLGEP